MKKTVILLLYFCIFSLFNSDNLFASYSDYFNLAIGNVFIYNCYKNYTYYCGHGLFCLNLGTFRLKIIIEDTINYSGHKYFYYSKEIHRTGGYDPFSALGLFPFNIGTYNTIRLDSLFGRVYYYDPANGCINETMIDSLNSKLNDTVYIKCGGYSDYYICDDTLNRKKYWCPYQGGTTYREYDKYIGFKVNHYYHSESYQIWIDSQSLSGSVINGVVWGDTSFTQVGISEIKYEIPTTFSLFQNYPNPFNPSTKIKFDIAPSPAGEGRGEVVTLKIYDILGREVATLVNEELKPGSYEYEWDGSRFASGVYFYKLTTESFSQTKRMVLLK